MAAAATVNGDENDAAWATRQDGQEHRNQVGAYASKVMRSEFNRVNAQLAIDVQGAIEGHAIYLPNLLSPKYDYSILRALAMELEEGLDTGMVSWSRHLKHEDPTFSATFKAVVQQLSAYFDVEVLATRLNFYRNGTDWKPYHHDSHAYGAKGKKEDFTIGASFGATRELSFLHVGSQTTFAFPQWNGDVFAFTSTANKTFQHGVPRSPKHAPRFSIIAWGKRRRLTSRNSTADEQRRREQGEDYTTAGDEDGGAGMKEGRRANALAFARAKLRAAGVRSHDAPATPVDANDGSSTSTSTSNSGAATPASPADGVGGGGDRNTGGGADASSPEVAAVNGDNSPGVGREGQNGGEAVPATREAPRDGNSGVPQVTDVSELVANFCKSMERYTLIEQRKAQQLRARQQARDAAVAQPGEAAGGVKADKKSKKEKKEKKKEKKEKKKVKGKPPKVKSRVQGSWGR